jgi:transposase
VEEQGVMLMLRAAEQLKLDILMKVLSGKLTRAQAQKLLNVSKSTLKRNLRDYRKKGASSVKHGNSGRKPKRAYSEEFKTNVKNIFTEKYFDTNVTHLHEKLSVEEKIEMGRETLRKWCHEWRMVKRSKRRKSKPRYYRECMPQKGLMLQMDGSHHAWFGGKKSVLIAAIDDATNEIPYAEFFTSEDTFNCMKVIRKIVETYGIFQVLYTDRAGIFGGSKRQNFAHLKRACEELGIQVVYAYSPEAKGRVERLFNTLQDRLCVEMRIRNITTFAEANFYLQNDFLPRIYSDRFTHQPQNPESAYQPLSSEINLDEVFCLKDYRRIYNDHTIMYQTKFYQLRPDDGISIAGHEVELREYSQGPWKLFYRGKEMPHQILKKVFKHPPWWVDRKGSESRGT